MRNRDDAHISICRRGFVDSYAISSTNDFLKNKQVKVSFFDDKLIISIPSLDWSGKSYVPCSTGKNCFSFAVNSDNIRIGKFPIDIEESNEDNLVIYYENEEN